MSDATLQNICNTLQSTKRRCKLENDDDWLNAGLPQEMQKKCIKENQ